MVRLSWTAIYLLSFICKKRTILLKNIASDTLTTTLLPHIIIPVRLLLRCSPVFCFYPHFFKRNLGQEARCHAPVLCTPGDGRKLPPGTGLLNIAGEKIEDSGILGLPQRIERDC